LHCCRAATIINPPRPSKCIPDRRRLPIQIVALHTAEEREYIPEIERWKVGLVARIWCAVFCVVIGWSIAIGSILPLMFVGLPSFCGAWLHLVFNLTQHAGLAEDVLDHRLNTRTVYLNPIFRFIYWNMNYTRIQ